MDGSSLDVVLDCLVEAPPPSRDAGSSLSAGCGDESAPLSSLTPSRCCAGGGLLSRLLDSLSLTMAALTDSCTSLDSERCREPPSCCSRRWPADCDRVRPLPRTDPAARDGARRAPSALRSPPEESSAPLDDDLSVMLDVECVSTECEPTLLSTLGFLANDSCVLPPDRFLSMPGTTLDGGGGGVTSVSSPRPSPAGVLPRTCDPLR